MGKNNKARRAAKARHRGRRQRTDRQRDDHAPGAGDGPGRPPRHEVLGVAERLLLDRVSLLWTNGWQPTELHRQARIDGRTTGAVRLVELVVAVDCARRLAGREQLHPAWREQAEQLGVSTRDSRDGWLDRWLSNAEHTADAEVLALVDEAGAVLAGLPAIDVLVPPPGRSESTRRTRRPVATDPVLQRVRNLLAKAESTEFEAEATALTAKAQELITRHAIDAALLSGGTDDDAAPTMIRVPIDAPYANAKSLLLQTVAAASRCRAVFVPRLSHTNVVGLAADLAAVEVLFTSLLVQAQHALAAAARSAAPGTRTRSQSYRSAFLLAFSCRIGERLEEVNEHVFGAAAGDSSRFLPVLSSQQAAIDDLMAERFGTLHTGRVRGGHDPAGWVGGRLAADQARLTAGDLDTPGTAARR